MEPLDKLFFENAYDAESTPDHRAFVMLKQDKGVPLKLEEGACVTLEKQPYTILKIYNDESKGMPECTGMDLKHIDTKTVLHVSANDSTLSKLELLKECPIVKGGKKKKTKRRNLKKKKTKRR